jgi:hypothetical protein
LGHWKCVLLFLSIQSPVQAPHAYHMIYLRPWSSGGYVLSESSLFTFQDIATASYVQEEDIISPIHANAISRPHYFYSYIQIFLLPSSSLRECNVKGRDQSLCKPEWKHQFWSSHQKLGKR